MPKKKSPGGAKDKPGKKGKKRKNEVVEEEVANKSQSQTQDDEEEEHDEEDEEHHDELESEEEEHVEEEEELEVETKVSESYLEQARALLNNNNQTQDESSHSKNNRHYSYDDSDDSDDDELARKESPEVEEVPEEEEEEEEVEEEEVEEEEAEEVVEPPESEDAALALEAYRTELINEYISAKTVLKYERKRNAYFQDRIYRTSVRKGIIVEAELKEETKLEKKRHKAHMQACKTVEKKKKKHRRRHKNHQDDEDEEEEHDEEEHVHPEEKEGEEEKKDKVAVAEIKKSVSKSMSKSVSKSVDISPTYAHLVDANEDEDEEEEDEEDEDEEEEEDEEEGIYEPFIDEELGTEMRYMKLIRKIVKLQRARVAHMLQHQANLQKHTSKCGEWKKLHEVYIKRLLDAVRHHSENSVDSSTGKRLNRNETEDYCVEITKIHKKLCRTMLKMYKSRKGVELTLRRLQESEIQDGEGLEILEYEELKFENALLKERLSDRVRDVENIKTKMEYAIQCLSHMRTRMHNMNSDMSHRKEYLRHLDKDVHHALEYSSQVMKEYEKVRREERALIVDSGLLDNPPLLEDYELTHDRVSQLKDEKKELQKRLVDQLREIQSLKDKALELRRHFPAFVEEFEKKQTEKKRKKSLIL